MTEAPDEDAFYAAVGERDPDYDGVFYVGVRTTGVFCRPSCPARPPKRENCEFFRSAQQAMLANHRPCERCRPLSHPGETPAVVLKLIDAVDREPEKRWRNADFEALAWGACAHVPKPACCPAALGPSHARAIGNPGAVRAWFAPPPGPTALIRSRCSREHGTDRP